jgi:hypothetical protein
MEDNISNNDSNESLYESEGDSYPVSMEISEIGENEYNYIKFIQAIKDDNLDIVEEVVNINAKCNNN